MLPIVPVTFIIPVCLAMLFLTVRYITGSGHCNQQAVFASFAVFGTVEALAAISALRHSHTIPMDAPYQRQGKSVQNKGQVFPSFRALVWINAFCRDE